MPEPGSWRVPMAAHVQADSAEEAHKVMEELLRKRHEEHPDHPIKLDLGPVNEVQLYTSPSPPRGRTRK